MVPRAVGVGVRWVGLDGEVREQEWEGFPARIFQHEHDHLEGLFFTDRITDNKNLVSETEWLKRFV